MHTCISNYVCQNEAVYSLNRILGITMCVQLVYSSFGVVLLVTSGLHNFEIVHAKQMHFVRKVKNNKKIEKCKKFTQLICLFFELFTVYIVTML